MRFDDAWWLVIIASSLTAAAYAAAAVLGYSNNMLILFGFLSGVIYALTNANDRRAVNGRPVLREPRAFSEVEFLATAGLFGVLTTWVLLPIIYFPFASLLNYSPQLTDDIIRGFSVGIALGSVTVPWFVLTGAFTILSTLAYLYVLRDNTVELLAVVGPLIYVMDILAGLLLFGDEAQSYEKSAIFPVIIIVFLVLSLARSRSTDVDGTADRQPTPGRRLLPSIRAIGSLAIYVLVTFLLDVSIRGSLESLDGVRQFFVSLCFRATYFSIFLVFVLAWWLMKWRKVSAAEDLADKIQDGRARKLTLALVTPLTFSLAFALKMPVVSNNLAVGPIVYFAGQTLALALVGVLYKTDGSEPRLLGRFKQVYLRSESQGIQKYVYLISYLLLFLIVVVWLSLRLAL